jgi:predicted alpha-1,2-mannosidase
MASSSMMSVHNVRIAAPVQPLDYVDEDVGTANSGNTSPDAAAPFGMIEWGPAAFDKQENGNFSDSHSTTGLSLTNMSGVGCAALGDVPILPISGSLPKNLMSAAEPVLDAKAQPGSWSGQIGARKVATSIAVTTRTGIANFVFPAREPSYVILKTGDSSGGNSGAAARIVGRNEIVGSTSGGSFCGPVTPYTLFFVVRFAQPFNSSGSWSSSGISQSLKNSAGAGSGVWVNFGQEVAIRKVTMKVGISFVSQQNAELNLQKEDPGWSLSTIVQQTQSLWNTDLGTVKVSGGTPSQLTMLYTALYHSLLAPETYSDVNGDYLRFGCSTTGQSCEVEKVQPGHIQYSDFSGWDIQLSEIPLLAILFPKIVSDMASSLANDAIQGGAFPRWPVANYETGIMEGDPADEIIAEADAFGAQGFDVTQTLELLVEGATNPTIGTSSASGQETYQERPGLSEYQNLGYVPSNIDQFATSTTLQYATDDFAVSRLAQNLGDASDALTLAASSNNWNNIYDPLTSTMGVKDDSGAWLPVSYVGTDSQYGFREANAAQYTWSVPQNLPGLFAAMGGDSAAIANLNQFFSSTSEAVNEPFYTPGNEEDLMAPWEYDATSAPWDTQALTRSLLDDFYGTSPSGLPGNDDLGEISSWEVWDMLGLYPLIPGTDILAVGAPIFPQVAITPTDGSTITINAAGANDESPYVQSLTLNGQPLTADWTEWNSLDPGPAKLTNLDFVMGATPNMSRTSPSSEIPDITGDGYTSTWNRAITTVP